MLTMETPKKDVNMFKMEQWSGGLDTEIQIQGSQVQNQGGSKVDSAFHPSEVDKMSTRNSWDLNGKK